MVRREQDDDGRPTEGNIEKQREMKTLFFTFIYLFFLLSYAEVVEQKKWGEEMKDRKTTFSVFGESINVKWKEKFMQNVRFYFLKPGHKWCRMRKWRGRRRRKERKHFSFFFSFWKMKQINCTLFFKFFKFFFISFSDFK